MNCQMKKSPIKIKQNLSLAIIGAGFAGLCMAIQLKKAGFSSFTIFEKSDGVGGTWRQNTYPGAACDIPSFLYSFSFESKKDWNFKYARQPEILKYLEHCALKYNLYPHIHFNTELVAARFDENSGLWYIKTHTGETHAVNVLVSACGQLSRPYIPEISGLTDFKGVKFHSANWNHEYSFEHKNVGVIGNGASAIQFIPHLQKKARSLIVFQRSPHWILPKREHKFKPIELWLFKHIPYASKFYRYLIYFTFEFNWLAFFPDSWLSQIITKLYRHKVLRRLNRIKSDHLRSVLLPNYPLGCKRILLSDNYYEVIQQNNVSIVTESIQRIEENALLTKEGKSYSVDAIIFATGFRATEFLLPLQIEGLESRDLQQEWQLGAEAYKGIAVTGFPNLFLLYGPNTNLGHNSIILMLENQVKYILQCINILSRENLKFMNVRPSSQNRYNQRLQTQALNTVWNSDCTNWYKNKDGKIINNWPYSTWKYFLETRRVDLSAFDFFPNQESCLTKSANYTISI